MFPILSLETTHREIGLLLAVIIGFAFGFVLERAGFGHAKKLSAQFYLYDMTVFKVMFSAIVTAMLGLTVLGAVQGVDTATIIAGAASETFVWPMIAGGFMLGVGFLMSGYCPGTSLVASASGKLDGVVTVVGVVLGSLAFGFAYPWVEGFAKSGALGQRFLDQVTGLSRPVLAGIVAVVALGAFLGAERVEAWMRRRRRERGADPAAEPDPALEPAPAGRSRRFVFAGVGAATVLAIGTLAVPGAPRASVPPPPPPAAQPASAVRSLSPAGLARRLVEAPWTVMVVDVRAAKACQKKSIPGAECVPLAKLKDMGLDAYPPAKDLVLVGQKTLHPVPRAARTYRGRIFVLSGGFSAWRAYALSKPTPPGPKAPPSAWEAYRFRAAFHQAMTGRKAAPVVRAPRRFVPRRRGKRKGGCS